MASARLWLVLALLPLASGCSSSYFKHYPRTDDSCYQTCFPGTTCIDGMCRAACESGQRDEQESDVDCGGPSSGCQPCAAGLRCTSGGDCRSGVCTDGKCAAVMGFTMASRSPIAMPGATAHVRAGDLDGDRRDEIGIADTDLEVRTPDLLPIGHGSLGVNRFELADFDGDGRLDLAAVGNGGMAGELGILLGRYRARVMASNGRGFPIRARALYQDSVDGLVTGDFNGDSRRDLVVVGDQFLIFDGTGGGALAPPRAVTQKGGIFGTLVLARDLDGDGALDLVAWRKGAAIWVSVLFGHGDGTFEPPIDLGNFVAIDSRCRFTTADLDGDGRHDVVAGATGDDRVAVFLQNAPRHFAPALDIAVKGVQDVAPGDLDGDGRTDLLVLAPDAPRLALGNGDGTFRVAKVPFVKHSPWMAVVADFDADGALDVCTGANAQGPAIAWGDGRGGFGALEGDGSPIAVGDVDHDGLPDLVTTDMVVLRNLGKRTFVRSRPYYLGSEMPEEVADFDGDGRADVLTTGFGPYADDSALLVRGDGAGGLLDGTPEVELEGTPVSSTVADVDGDKRPDLVVATLKPDTIQVLRGTGRLEPGAPQMYALAGEPGQVIATDLDGDRVPDLVVTRPAAGTIELLRGAGDGTFTALGRVEDVPDISSISAADLDGDGDADIAAIGSDGAHLYLGDGKGGLQPTGAAVVPRGPARQVALIDFNHDGHPDAVFASALETTAQLPDPPPGGTLSCFAGDGHGGFLPPVYFDIPAEVTQMHAGDLDHDGRIDLLLVDKDGFLSAMHNEFP